MHLTQYTDYSLRVLIHLAAEPERATVRNLARSYGISRNHLVKIVNQLGKLGYIHTHRGRMGGISLARRPEEITIGQVVRQMEPHFHLVECFKEECTCPILPVCLLRGAIGKAEAAFLEVLDGFSLADVSSNQDALLEALGRARREPAIRSRSLALAEDGGLACKP